MLKDVFQHLFLTIARQIILVKLSCSFVILLSVVLISCRKECQTKKLPDVKCSNGYGLINGTTPHFHGNLYSYPYQLESIINDDSAYIELLT